MSMDDCTHESLSKRKEDVENVHQLFDSDRFCRRVLNQFDDDQLDFMDRFQESNISPCQPVEHRRVSASLTSRPTLSMQVTIWSELRETCPASRASTTSTRSMLDRMLVDSRPIHDDSRCLECRRTVEELPVRHLDTNRIIAYTGRSTGYRHQRDSPAQEWHRSLRRVQ